MSSIDQKLLSILCCPECRGELVSQAGKLICSAEGRSFNVVDGIPVFYCHEENTWDIDISSKKWHEFYKGFDWEGGKEHYAKTNFPYIVEHFSPVRQGDLFLELGGGASYLSYGLSEMGAQVVTIDFDIDILRLARKNFNANKQSGFFICANISKLPFKSNVFDISAGIGVIEHSKNINTSLIELNRVTKVGGYTFQTVPCFSLLTIINNSFRFGTFTPMPLFNKFIKFLHMNVLKKKYMKYGYEESYTVTFMKKLLLKNDFKDAEVDFYDYNQTVLKRFPFLSKKFLYDLVRRRFFWDIIYLKAFK